MSVHLYVLVAENKVIILDQQYWVIIQFTSSDVACYFLIYF